MWLLPQRAFVIGVMILVGLLCATQMVAAPVASGNAPVNFTNDVIPILTRFGCNQGACHGAQYGKGGFKLSLAGFDPGLDHDSIVKQARGRRVTIVDPARSLLLTKPLMKVPHGGGRRLDANSPEYQTLLRWLRQGAPGPNSKDPQVVRLEVTPPEQVLSQGQAPVQIRVRAFYDDRSVRDVTRLARISSLNDAVVSCTPEGVVRPVGRGQTAIMVRFSGLAAVATMIVPFRKAPAPSAEASRQAVKSIDTFVERKQHQLGLTPSPLCDDLTFIRRVFFDLIGTPPKPEEIRAFLADKSSDRRARLIDSLLERPEYADFWALKWGDLLRSNRMALGLKGMWSYTNWIRAQFRRNRPIHEMVYELLTAQGSTFTNGPSNYFRVARSPQDLAETTSQVFLGVRIQCARCHQHPFERWSQKDYYQFAAFFARVGLKDSQEFGLFGGEQVVRVRDDGEVHHPKSGERMRPAPLGVQLASHSAQTPDPDAVGDRRQLLAEWITGKSNRLFARNIANRYWGYLFGRGIVNPIDDMRVTNPPTHPELLDFLADELVRSNYNLKHLLRLIANSKAYQRSSDILPGNHLAEPFYTHYPLKRLPAETLLDAIDFACGTQEKFPELPPGTRAIQLPDPGIGSEFLDTFGRPMRLTSCECERSPEPNLSQTLRLLNGDLVNRKVSQHDGRVARLIASGRSDRAILEELYMVTLGRPPRPRERAKVLGVLMLAPDRKAVFEDVLLTLLNSKEFLFNH